MKWTINYATFYVIVQNVFATYLVSVEILFTDMINQQMHAYKMFNHILLSFTNMFRSTMWPPSACLIVNIIFYNYYTLYIVITI